MTNFALIWRQIPEAEQQGIASQCLNNVGRTFIENYSTNDFAAGMPQNTLAGVSVAALSDAVKAKRPVILVTGHYKNYKAVRAVMMARGLNLGGLSRDMENPYFKAHYVKTMVAFGGPVVPEGRRGAAGFVRHLKDGEQFVLFFHQHVFGAPSFDFLGQPANTATSAADLAVRYDALTFETVIEAPIQPSDAATMTQAITVFWPHAYTRARHLGSGCTAVSGLKFNQHAPPLLFFQRWLLGSKRQSGPRHQQRATYQGWTDHPMCQLPASYVRYWCIHRSLRGFHRA